MRSASRPTISKFKIDILVYASVPIMYTANRGKEGADCPSCSPRTRPSEAPGLAMACPLWPHMKRDPGIGVGKGIVQGLRADDLQLNSVMGGWDSCHAGGNRRTVCLQRSGEVEVEEDEKRLRFKHSTASRLASCCNMQSLHLRIIFFGCSALGITVLLYLPILMSVN